MKIFTKKEPKEIVTILVWVQIILCFLAFFIETISSRNVLSLSFLVHLFLLVMVSKFYRRALRNLLYTYWNITIFAVIYYCVSFTRNLLVLDYPFTAVLYLSNLVLIAFSSYIISSPLYYPIVNWWEYDFRYRADLRIWVLNKNEKLRSRLTDLRRGAGCVVMFQQFNVGETINIQVELLGRPFDFPVKIISKKEPIVGRTVIYGVKFIFDNLEREQRFKLLVNHWSENKRLKIRSKFSLNQST
jgi:hypothetical protein